MCIGRKRRNTFPAERWVRPVTAQLLGGLLTNATMDISDVSRVEALLQQVRARAVARQARPDVSALDEVLDLLHGELILRRAAHQETDMQQA